MLKASSRRAIRNSRSLRTGFFDGRTEQYRPPADAHLNDPAHVADAVVWADVVQRSYDDSELNWTYLSFMTLATLLVAAAATLLALCEEARVGTRQKLTLGRAHGRVGVAATDRAARRRFLHVARVRRGR